MYLSYTVDKYMTHNTCARRHTLATYDIFSFAQRNGNPALLLTPQRCGSSFTKKIINNLKPHERNHLTWLVWNENKHPGTNLDAVTMMRRLYVPQHHWSYKVNRSATWFDPTIKINMVYRSPTARYVSGLHFLNGSWQDSFSQPIMQWALEDEETSKDERQDFIHKLMKILGRRFTPYDNITGDDIPETHTWFLQEFEINAVKQVASVLPEGTMHSIRRPFLDFTFGESHLEPAMIWCAFIACMYERSDFVLLEQYTDWVQENLTIGTPVTDIEGEEQLEMWKTGRNSVTDSKYITDQGQAMLDVLVKHIPSMTQEPDTENQQLINWTKWIGLEEEVFDFVLSHKGKFSTTDSKRALIDYMIGLLNREDMLVVRDLALLYWLTLDRSMNRLPKDLQLALQRNIGRGSRLLCDEGPFNWALWARKW